MVRQAATPTVGNERVFICYQSTGGAGVTGAVEPTWTVTRGAQNLDNTVRWQEITGVAAINADLSANTPNWTTIKNTAITLGQVIQSGDGTKVLLNTSSGTAGNGAEPTWAAYTTTGSTTADNTAGWTTVLTSTTVVKWAAPHARLANAFTATWGQAGNSFFVASEHAETQASAITLTSPGAVATPCAVDCVGKATVPPIVATTGATISTTGASNLTFGAVQHTYWNGISFTAGSAANAANINWAGGSPFFCFFKSCGFTLGNTNVGSTFLWCNSGGGTRMRIVFDSSTFTFGSNTGQSITSLASDISVLMRGGSFAVAANVPTTLFVSAPPQTVLEGVDLSAFGSGNTLVGATAGAGGGVTIKDCKLNASVTVAATPTTIRQDVVVIRSDSAGTNYQTQKYHYTGTQTVETTIVRTGGATDGTTPISWKILTTANSKWILPFECVPIRIWNDRVSTNVTVTLFGIWAGGAVPNNDNIWMDIEYLGASTSPLGSFATATKADNLASGVALSTDNSTWGGSVTAFKMSVTLSSPQPLLKGYLNIYPKAALASSTFYIDPRPQLS